MAAVNSNADTDESFELRSPARAATSVTPRPRKKHPGNDAGDCYQHAAQKEVERRARAHDLMCKAVGAGGYGAACNPPRVCINCPILAIG
jgi:hypothetical protein